MIDKGCFFFQFETCFWQWDLFEFIFQNSHLHTSSILKRERENKNLTAMIDVQAEIVDYAQMAVYDLIRP